MSALERIVAWWRGPRPASEEELRARQDLLFRYLQAGGALTSMPLDTWSSLDPDTLVASLRAGERFWAWLAAQIGAASLSPEAALAVASTADGGALRRGLAAQRAAVAALAEGRRT